MALSPKQTIILGTGAAAILGLYLVRKKILGSIATAKAADAPPPPAVPSMVPGMGADPSAFDKVADTTNKAVSTVTGLIALTMGYFTLKEKKHALSAAPAPAPAPAAPAPRSRRAKRSRR